MSTVLQITLKAIKSWIRNWKSNAIVFVIPIVFMGIFGLAFGEDTTTLTFSTGLINASDTVEEGYSDYLVFLEELQNGAEQPLFHVTELESRSEADQLLLKDEVDGVIIWNGDGTLTVLTSPASTIGPALTGVITQVTDRVFFNLEPVTTVIPEVVTLEGTPDNTSAFQVIGPGLIVYGILLIASQVAVEFSYIRDKKEIFRYFTSKVQSWHIIVGYLLYFMIIGALMIVILIGTAIAFGLSVQGSLFNAFLISYPIMLFTIGLGLLLGGLARKPDTASSLATIVSIVLGFLSGSFINGISFDYLPTAQATKAIIEIIQFNASFSDVLDEFLYIVTASAIVLVVGIIVFHYRQLRSLE